MDKFMKIHRHFRFIGHSKPRFKSGYHDVCVRIRDIFPASKLVPFYIDGLTSKSIRTRVGVLEQLLSIIRDSGWRTVTRKHLAKVATQIDNEDKDVRSAAIACVVRNYVMLQQCI